MKNLLIILSYTGLALTVVPAFLSFYGLISFRDYEVAMVWGALLWFGSAPFWIFKKKLLSDK
jgi:hypothetical protein